MRGRDDRPDAGFAFSHRRECDAGGENAFFEKLAGEIHGELAVADDDWSDGGFASRRALAADVEAEQSLILFPKRVLSQSFFRSTGSFSRTSKAAMQVAATDGGCEVENKNGRARW